MSKEIFLTIVSVGIAVALAIAGEKVQNQYWSGIVGNVAVTFFGVGIGLLIVNHYLNRAEKRRAVASLLKMVAPSIRQHHNDLFDEAWNTFGRPQWGEMLKRYFKQNGDPLAFAPDERDRIYEMIKKSAPAYNNKLRKLEVELQELITILGWTFDPAILADALSCRYSIVKFCSLTFDDSTEVKRAALEHFLDAEILASRVHDRLAKLLGLTKDDIYQTV